LGFNHCLKKKNTEISSKSDRPNVTT